MFVNIAVVLAAVTSVAFLALNVGQGWLRAFAEPHALFLAAGATLLAFVVAFFLGGVALITGLMGGRLRALGPLIMLVASLALSLGVPWDGFYQNLAWRTDGPRYQEVVRQLRAGRLAPDAAGRLPLPVPLRPQYAPVTAASVSAHEVLFATSHDLNGGYTGWDYWTGPGTPSGYVVAEPRGQGWYRVYRVTPDR